MKTTNGIRCNAFQTTAFLIVFILGMIQSGHGAGVTIITHGYELNSIDENHNWVVAMSDSIADRAGGNAAVYEMVIGMNSETGKPAVGSFDLVSGTAPTANANSPVSILPRRLRLKLQPQMWLKPLNPSSLN